MKMISLVCDAPGCSNKSAPIPESTSFGPKHDPNDPDPKGWYFIGAEDGYTARSAGFKLADGGYACSKKCALAIVSGGLDASRSIRMCAAPQHLIETLSAAHSRPAS